MRDEGDYSARGDAKREKREAREGEEQVSFDVHLLAEK